LVGLKNDGTGIKTRDISLKRDLNPLVLSFKAFATEVSEHLENLTGRLLSTKFHELARI